MPLVFTVGSDVSILSNLQAADVVDGDISGQIIITSGEVDNLQEGEYLVEAEVTNSYGDKAQIELPVWMVSRNDTLVNINLRSFLVYLDEGDSFYPRNYLSSVVLPDGSNGDIYDVEIKEQVDTAVPGSYAVQYSYDSADGDGFTVMVVVVKEKESENGTGN